MAKNKTYYGHLVHSSGLTKPGEHHIYFRLHLPLGQLAQYPDDIQFSIHDPSKTGRAEFTAERPNDPERYFCTLDTFAANNVVYEREILLRMNNGVPEFLEDHRLLVGYDGELISPLLILLLK